MKKIKLIIEKIINNLTLEYTEDLNGNIKGRVALFYIVHPLLIPKSHRNKVRFSNDGIAQNIPRVLNELGYIVDIIHFKNKGWALKHDYDFIICHGGDLPPLLYPQLPSRTKKIFFSTGRYWKDANLSAAKRLLEFTSNTGYLLQPERNIITDEEYGVINSDAIICLGNEELAKDYRKYNKNTYCINNGVFPFNSTQKPKLKNSKNVLFLAGRGNIHKGLDLLIDVFSNNPDFTLHVCQHIDNDFNNVINNKLQGSKNIIIHDFVKMRSPEFDAIANSCSYSILPTCSEGQPGSVLECMQYGLVPIISKEANIDFDTFVVKIDTLDSQGVEQSLYRIKELSDEKYSHLSSLAIQSCAEKYSEQAFRESFRKVINTITGNGVID